MTYPRLYKPHDPLGVKILWVVTLSLLLSALVCAATYADVRELPVVETTVAVQEVHSLYDDNGRHVFDQVIYWQFDGYESRYVCDGWRLLKVPAQFPHFDTRRNVWVAVWLDGDCLRRVRSPAFRESFMQTDREIENREFLPRDQRRELGRRP